VIFGNQNGFSRGKDSPPSWASAVQSMDFLATLNASPFAFTEPNLQWDSTLLKEATTLQRKFFLQGHLVASESNSQFPTSHKPGGTCIGVNGKWKTRVTANLLWSCLMRLLVQRCWGFSFKPHARQVVSTS
jgi:hypothetical protein